MSRADPPLAPASAALVDTLYRRHSSWLSGVVRHLLGGHAADAEDMVQEAYIRVARYGPDDAQRHPRALLRQIAVNLARDHMRRNVVRGGAAVPLEVVDAGCPQLAVAPAQDSALQLKQVVLGLPQRYRDVFILSRFTRMSNEDIARHFAISVKTVEWRLTRALALCAEHLQD